MEGWEGRKEGRDLPGPNCSSEKMRIPLVTG